MNKVFILFLVLFSGLFLINIENTNALQTYIGVKILNLTDDPASSCANQPGYGPQGRIRALSSTPSYPFYFELRYHNNGSLVEPGRNTTVDADFTIGETIMYPNLVNLQSGINYRLMIDVDAIRIYLPLVTSGGFIKTYDNNYWTIGVKGTDDAQEYFEYSGENACNYNSIVSEPDIHITFLSNNRSQLTSPCYSDNSNNNCRDLGIMGFSDYRYYHTNDFKTDSKYDNLYLPNVGNINLIFTMP